MKSSARSCLSLAALLLFAAPLAHADDSKGKGKDDAKAATIELMHSVLPPSAYEAMLDQIYVQMSASMRQSGGAEIPADKQASLKAAVKECIPYDEIITWTGEVYAKHFTKKEIDDLAAFYKTPTGKKVARMLPTVSGEIGAKLGPVLMKRMPAAMEKHGLK